MDVPAGLAINAYLEGLRPNQTHDGRGKYGISPHASAFKDQLESCLAFFRRLIEAMIQSVKDVPSASPYFSPIILQLDDELIRLEIWATDTGAEDPDFGIMPDTVPPDLVLTRHLSGLLFAVLSYLKAIETHVDGMQNLIERLSGN